jgi:SNF2 family DNA or RNA helicase
MTKYSDFTALLAAKINLEREHQQRAVQWALTRLLDHSQRGVILADEVGCGKTYEALATLALLWQHFRATSNRFQRVLILCKPSLIRKWQEEITEDAIRPDGSKHGLRPYLSGRLWRGFKEGFIESLYIVDNLRRAERLWTGADGRILSGIRQSGKIQVPHGLYLVNHLLLYENSRERAKILKYLHRSYWDLVIVDEAHHYGKGNNCDGIFAKHYRKLGRGEVPDFGAAGTLHYKRILLLTATPFELRPSEMLNLLRIAKAPDSDLDRLKGRLDEYQKLLGNLYDLRALPVKSDQRRAVVQRLLDIRTGAKEKPGLEELLRGYIVRNLKETAQRQHGLITKNKGTWSVQHFKMFDKLEDLCRQASLIPFSGRDVLFYLQLRELIQETVEHSKKGGSGRTFVAMDLQQGLSSYPQLLAKSNRDHTRRLLERSLPTAQRLRRMLEQWDKQGKLHPKVQALTEVVNLIVEEEITRVESTPDTWFAKIVIFNKLVAGTAPHLRKQLENRLHPRFEEFLNKMVSLSGLRDTKELRQRSRKLVRIEAKIAREEFSRKCEERNESPILPIRVLKDSDFKTSRETHAVDALLPYFERRATQPLFMIDYLRQNLGNFREDNYREFLRERLIQPAMDELEETVDKYLDSRPDQTIKEPLGRRRLYETGIANLTRIREKLRTPELVARFDGEVTDDRESNRLNFNNRWSPVVLLVSHVGEEGIDLQQQARYVLHYDLEWNPAKMEQREGRVDREGYGFRGLPIDIRFFLLKGTYEERIFHTVMQRGQWFQILMGDRRRELGRISDDENHDEEIDAELLEQTGQEADAGTGYLTFQEKEGVMIDLRPTGTRE